MIPIRSSGHWGSGAVSLLVPGTCELGRQGVWISCQTQHTLPRWELTTKQDPPVHAEWCTRHLSSPTAHSLEIRGQCSQVHGLGVSAFGLVPCFLGFPDSSVGKESACNAGDLGSTPRLGRSPGERKGYLLRYSGLENSVDCIVHGVAKSQTWLRDFHFHFFAPFRQLPSQDPTAPWNGMQAPVLPFPKEMAPQHEGVGVHGSLVSRWMISVPFS